MSIWQIPGVPYLTQGLPIVIEQRRREDLARACRACSRGSGEPARAIWNTSRS